MSFVRKGKLCQACMHAGKLILAFTVERKGDSNRIACITAEVGSEQINAYLHDIDFGRRLSSPDFDSKG